jgi:serine/threonine protein kinase
MLDIPRCFDKYEILHELGTGGFSVAFLVRNRSTREELACKVVSRSGLVESNTFTRFEQEVRLLQQLHHRNLVSVQEVIFDASFIYLIMDYCSGGDLCSYIQSYGRLDDYSARFMFAQLVDAMAYLHERSIAHRDLKPENILLDGEQIPRITDLGLCHANVSNRLLSTPCGTTFYAAPELISGEEYDGKAIDVWSLGVVLYVMSTGSLPWTNLNFPELTQEIVRCDFAIPRYISPQCEDLMRAMMCPNPVARPTMRQIADHPWVCGFLDKEKAADPNGDRLRSSGSLGMALTSGMRRMSQSRSAKMSSSSMGSGMLPPLIVGDGAKAEGGGGEGVKNLMRRVPSTFSKMWTRAASILVRPNYLIGATDVRTGRE